MIYLELEGITITKKVKHRNLTKGSSKLLTVLPFMTNKMFKLTQIIKQGTFLKLSLMTTKMFTKTKIIKLENLTKGRSQLVAGGRRKQR